MSQVCADSLAIRAIPACIKQALSCLQEIRPSTVSSVCRYNQHHQGEESVYTLCRPPSDEETQTSYTQDIKESYTYKLASVLTISGTKVETVAEVSTMPIALVIH